MTLINFDKDKAIYNPGNYFKIPMEIVETTFLNLDEKLVALRNWELDIRLNDIAEEENMPAFKSARLSDKPKVELKDILDAREKLAASGAHLSEHSQSTKLGM